MRTEQKQDMGAKQGEGRKEQYQEKQRYLEAVLQDERLFETFLTKVEENTQLAAPGDLKERILVQAEQMEMAKRPAVPKKKQLGQYRIRMGFGMAAAIFLLFAAGFAQPRPGEIMLNLRMENEAGDRLTDEIGRTLREFADTIAGIAGGRPEFD